MITLEIICEFVEVVHDMKCYVMWLLFSCMYRLLIIGVMNSACFCVKHKSFFMLTLSKLTQRCVHAHLHCIYSLKRRLDKLIIAACTYISMHCFCHVFRLFINYYILELRLAVFEMCSELWFNYAIIICCSACPMLVMRHLIWVILFMICYNDVLNL